MLIVYLIEIIIVDSLDSKFSQEKFLNLIVDQLFSFFKSLEDAELINIVGSEIVKLWEQIFDVCEFRDFFVLVMHVGVSELIFDHSCLVQLVLHIGEIVDSLQLCTGI